MKTTILLSALIVICSVCHPVAAQNTFPASGNVGIGTSSPTLDLHLYQGDTPAIRLDQNASLGYSAQTWDVAGNEANFFIRDVTHSSHLCLRIIPGAPSNSLYIQSTGYVGLGTSTPQANLDVPGTIKIGFTNLFPSAGMIHFSDSIFEGFDGNKWRSFTQLDSTERVSVVNQSVDSTVSRLATLNTALTAQVLNLQNQINSLQSQIDALGSASGTETINSDVPVAMLQNKPNPFNGSTIIEYSLSESANDAMISICDLKGAQLFSYPLDGNSKGSISISADKLKPGIYLYSLIIDGNLTVSRKMVVTK